MCYLTCSTNGKVACPDLVRNRSKPGRNIFFGTTYIDNCIRNKFPMKRRIVYEHCYTGRGYKPQRDHYIFAWNANGLANWTLNDKSYEAHHYSGRSWITGSCCTSECSFMSIERIQTATPTQRILLARGTHQAGTNVSFQLLVRNLSKKSFEFHKQICIALGLGTPECSVEPVV